MSDKIYKKQVGGTHYKSMVIQPSEFINRNNIPFTEGNANKIFMSSQTEKSKRRFVKSKTLYWHGNR